jgi:hypothetical protein
MAPMSWNWNTLNQECWAAAKAVGHYLSYLRNDLKILPHDIEFTRYRFHDLIKYPPTLAALLVSQFACSVHRCRCMSEPNHNLFMELKREVENIKQRKNGFLCLDCIKTDGRSKAEGQCRISHS